MHRVQGGREDNKKKRIVTYMDVLTLKEANDDHNPSDRFVSVKIQRTSEAVRLAVCVASAEIT
jgi:hypothetical protein